MTPDKFYEKTSNSLPFLLLKRTDKGDFIHVNGKWSSTDVILDYMYGNNDWVEDITEEVARAKYPEAF